MSVLRPTAADAVADWAARVRANAAQVNQYREVDDGADFYGPITAAFRADPHRTGDPQVETLTDLLLPGESVLDIGAGAGRLALPLALHAREVVAVDPSEGMLASLREIAAAAGITNVRAIPSRWPMPADPPRADVSLIANVGMDIEHFGAFLDAMEASTNRLCTAVMTWLQPTAIWDTFWPAVHGVDRATLPALPEFLTLLLARGRRFELRLLTRPATGYESRDDILAFLYRQLWIKPGGEKDARLQRELDARLTRHEGRIAVSWEPVVTGIVTWAPR